MSDKNKFFLRYTISSELITAYTFNGYQIAKREGQDAFVTKGPAKKYKNDIFEKDYLNGIYLLIDSIKTRKNITTNNEKLSKDFKAKGISITYTPTPTPPCEDYEYTFLSHSNRAELKEQIDKLKALDWFKEENKIAMSTFSTYNSSNNWNEYFIAFYPTNSKTKVSSGGVTGIKNTKDNLYQYAYIKCVSRQYERLFYAFWYDKSDNTNPNISFRVNNSYANLSTSTLCPTGISNFKPSFLDDYGEEIFVYLQCNLKFANQCGVDIPKPIPPHGGHPGGQEPTPTGYKLHLYIDKVTMGQLTLCKPQLEVGTIATDWKPNPNDVKNAVETTVKVIEDKVTKLETRVGTIEAEVKDNKTTITNIKGEVDKKITEQDNKIANITVKSQEITTTVQNLQTKTTELEGKVTDTAEGLKKVEQKITPDGISSMVQDKITQAKNEAITEADGHTDSKLTEYTLKDNFTEFKQSAEAFQLKVSQTGTTNILKNSRPRNFNKDFWYIGYNYHTMYRYFDGTNEATATENYQGEVFRSGLWFTMWAPTVPEGWLFLANNSIREYKFNTQKTYTIDFLLYSDNPHTDIYIQVSDDNGANQVFYSGNIHLKHGYNRLTYEFKPKVEGNQPNFMIVINNRRGEDINLYLPWVNFYEGYKITDQHVADGRGLVDSLTTIDKNGIKCNFNDGTWASMGRDGFNYYTQGMTNPYKYINFTTKITGVRNGHWVNVQLPPCFLRKNIDRDFVVQAWAGAIDSDAFARHQQDAVRNLFIEVGNWNNETRILQVRPCLQKIGIATKTLFGWDSATTSRGNPIGEGKIDIILLVQM